MLLWGHRDMQQRTFDEVDGAIAEVGQWLCTCATQPWRTGLRGRHTHTWPVVIGEVPPPSSRLRARWGVQRSCMIRPTNFVVGRIRWNAQRPGRPAL